MLAGVNVANRNRKSMSETIFFLLFERALFLDETFPFDLNPRWIKRQSRFDAELMAKADVTPLKLSMINAAALISYDGTKYFGVSGFNEPERLPTALSPIDLTPGLFASFVGAVRLDALATAAEIRDVVEGLSSAQTDYDGHELSAVARLFPQIRFYQIDMGYVYATSIDRILGAYVARGYSGGPLRLNADCKQRFAEFFEEGPDVAPYLLPLRGLLSFSLSGLYMELYRCIEQLYSVPKIVKLMAEWNSKRNIYDISKLLEDVLSWRPKEDESLELLFAELDVDLCRAIRRSIDLRSSKDARESPYRAAARRVYALRNAYVHFRPATQFQDVEDRQWNDIAINMLNAVERLYQLFGTQFQGPTVVEA